MLLFDQRLASSYPSAAQETTPEKRVQTPSHSKLKAAKNGEDDTVGQSDLSNPVPQELHSRERSSPRTNSATSTEALVD